MLDSFPASDKSFSRLLGEVPLLPDSALKLLEELCCADVTDHLGKDLRDVERVTQGLGAVWILILGRPLNRLSCLDIALKVTQDKNFIPFGLLLSYAFTAFNVCLKSGLLLSDI